MQPDRTAELTSLLQQRLLILDGAMGTMIQRHKLQEADYRGLRFADHPHDLKGNNDLLLLTRPESIRGILAEYLAAGFRADRSIHDAVAARGVEAGHELGDEPGEVIETMIERLRVALAATSDDVVIRTRFGAIRLGDYLQTRTVELVALAGARRVYGFQGKVMGAL